MGEPKTYLKPSSTHLHCENYKFQAGTPLKIFNTDVICSLVTWIDITGCSGILDTTTLQNLPNLEIIGFNNCDIEKIDKNTFSVLKNLRSINVMKSTFPLDESTFKNCDKIDNISFIQIENGINNVPIFKHLKNMRYLMIDHTLGLQLCKDTFSGLENLSSLFVQNCEIQEFNEDVFEPLTNLETLYFTGNILQSLSTKPFLTLKSLAYFGLYDNTENSQIDYQVFENLPNLDTISFPEQAINSLNFDTFKNLEAVHLSSGKPKENIVEFLEQKNISIQWTTDSDLTEEEEDIQICCA